MGGRVSSPTFVGRTEELGALEAAWSRAASNTPSVVLVAGEAGLGKTRLLAEMARRCVHSGGRALRGGCVPVGGGGLPYAPIVEMLRLLVDELGADAVRSLIGSSWGELARLQPRLGEPAVGPLGQADQTRMFELLLGLFGGLAGSSPLLLLVEDLHWADQTTRDLLAFLSRNLHRQPVLLVVTYRNDESSFNRLRPYLAVLERGGLVERLELPQLARAETLAQLTGILGAEPAPQLVDGVFARSEGNPFFTEELLQAIQAGSSGLPATVQDLLHGRVQALPAAGQRVLGIVAVAGRPVPQPLLAAVAEAQGLPVDEGVRAALEHQLLVSRPSGNGYDVRHALLRELVAAELPLGERARLHLVYAQVLSERPDLGRVSPAVAAAELAVHWDAAGQPARALPARVAAGVAADAAYAFPEALGHYRRALELWELGPAAGLAGGMDRAELLSRAAEAAASTGATERAIALFEEAIDRVDATAEPVRAAGMLARLGFHRFRARPQAAVFAAFDQAEQLLAGQPPSAEQARVHGARAHALWVSGRAYAAQPYCRQAIAAAQAAGAVAEEAHAVRVLGGCLGELGEPGGSG